MAMIVLDGNEYHHNALVIPSSFPNGHHQNHDALQVPTKTNGGAFGHWQHLSGDKLVFTNTGCFFNPPKMHTFQMSPHTEACNSFVRGKCIENWEVTISK